jgi:hypothetical protein
MRDPPLQKSAERGYGFLDREYRFSDRGYGADSRGFRDGEGSKERDRDALRPPVPRDPLKERDHLYPRSRMENGDRDRDLYREAYSSRLDRGETKDKGGKYSDFASDLRRSMPADPARYDLRSRPDGEVSEKLLASDAGKYGSLSAEKLRSFDREREREKSSQDVKLSMSAERLRILEEAERNRERRAQLSATGQRMVASTTELRSRGE